MPKFSRDPSLFKVISAEERIARRVAHLKATGQVSENFDPETVKIPVAIAGYIDENGIDHKVYDMKLLSEIYHL